MIVLDTNVLSEMMKPHPDQRVLRWFDHSSEEKWTTTISAGELVTGVFLLPKGQKRRALAKVVDAALTELIRQDAVLPYDIDAAMALGEVHAARKAMGRPIHDADAMIAAICRAHDASLATRNLKDFEGTGVTVVDPWEDD